MNDTVTITKGTGVSIGIMALVVSAIMYMAGLYVGLRDRVTILEYKNTALEVKHNSDIEDIKVMFEKFFTYESKNGGSK